MLSFVKARSFSSREKSIFILLVAVFSAHLFYNGLLKPIRGRGISLQQKWTSAQRELKKNLSLIRESPAIEREYADYAAYFLQTQEDEEQMSRLLSHLEAAASQSNVRLGEVKPQRITIRDFYNDFSVHVTMEEEWLTVMRFLYVLQNPPYFFAVTEMRLEKSPPPKTSLKCYLVLGRTLIRNSTPAD
jgi:Tfp pilus assembly protein PilO